MRVGGVGMSCTKIGAMTSGTDVDVPDIEFVAVDTGFGADVSVEGVSGFEH